MNSSWRGAAAMSIPIECDGETFGLLMIGPRPGRRRYRRTEAEAVAEVADQVARAMALAHDRRHAAPAR